MDKGGRSPEKKQGQFFAKNKRNAFWFFYCSVKQEKKILEREREREREREI
jgi:hypothetical protein